MTNNKQSNVVGKQFPILKYNMPFARNISNRELKTVFCQSNINILEYCSPDDESIVIEMLVVAANLT
ncbi:predicted protein [Sclerotinia sclerotiorum 1980 UF-70]|uniref:Uncharacterized protein n=1 Tax=Sclerotinia sclerotiorum (strain ATCC 18683 / 1980 / Ss-1) TaxID=665079 RepID=A7EIG8_SCLS1|nr:predicted protein [Sclerotinia sclerotiorum 1980 UF-70]EDO02634.1 predicted protein [Sclerotinia sclerotiorum 1980 UF-70]